MMPDPHIADRRLALISSEVRAYQMHFCRIDRRWLRHTRRARGEERVVLDH